MFSIIKYCNVLDSLKVYFVFIVFVHSIKRMLMCFKEDLNCNEFWSKSFKYCGRWLYALIPDIYGPLINFVRLAEAG